MEIIWPIIGFSYFLLVNIGLAAYIIALSLHLLRHGGFTVNLSVTKIVGAICGMGTYGMLILVTVLWEDQLKYELGYEIGYTLFLVPLPVYLIAYVLSEVVGDFRLTENLWVSLAIIFSFFGGWGLGQVVDWIRRK